VKAGEKVSIGSGHRVLSFELDPDADMLHALDSTWSKIDSGDASARVDLAQFFDDIGLFALGLDHWVYLLDNNPEYSLEAANGAAMTSTWLRDYPSARLFANRNPIVSEKRLSYIDESEAKFSLVKGDPEEIVGGLQYCLSQNAELFSAFQSSGSLDDFKALLQAEEFLMNLAFDLHFAPNSPVGMVGFEMQIAGSFALQRRVQDAVGEPVSRAVQFLASCANAIGMFGNQSRDDQGSNPVFVEAVSRGQGVANKLIHLGWEHRDEIPHEAKLALQNIYYGMHRIGNSDQEFAAFILAGITHG
jgi:hypothetical protein